MSPTATRAQLCGIALVLAGGFHDLQTAVRGFGMTGLGAVFVVVGVLLAVAGFLVPALNGIAAD